MPNDTAKDMSQAPAPQRLAPKRKFTDVFRGVLTELKRGNEHETCKIPDGRDVNQSVSHVRRVKANLIPAPIRNVPAQRSIH
jgi:hypothetical protein